jgi:iron complex transport system substrate-binding protein
MRASVVRALLWIAALLMPLQGVFAEPATRIVSLAPHLTELAFAAGAGDRIVATVEYSDSPEAARRIPRIGDAFLIDFERVLALRPDVVLAWNTGTPPATIERLQRFGLRVELLSTPRLHDVAVAVRRIGEIAGTQSEAESAAETFERDIAALRAGYRDREPVTVFVQINERPLYTVNDQHIISEIVALCGGRNVFGNLKDLAPAIGLEAVIAAKPQAILSVDESQPDAARAWQAWKHVPAVRARNIFDLPSDDLARPSTRLATGARAMCHALDTARDRLRGTRP